MTEEQRKKEKKRIRDRNYRFNRLTPAQKRVRIAKDVLARLETKQFVAKRGAYLELPHNHGLEIVMDRYKRAETYGRVPDQSDVIQLKAPLHKELEKGCQVCAIGACFSALVCRVDGVQVVDMLSKEDGLSGPSTMTSRCGRSSDNSSSPSSSP